jgi:putative inorganic carbon (HCO3(-)) transporter
VKHLRARPAVVVLAVGAAVAVGGAAGLGAAPVLSDHVKVLPEVMLAVAGALVLMVALLTIEPAVLLALGIGLSIFSGNWTFMHIPVPLDRVVTVVALLSVLLRALLDPDAPRIHARRVYWLLGALSLYAIASAGWVGTLTQHQAFFALLDRLGLEPFALFVVAPLVFRTAAQRRLFLSMLAVIGGYLGLTGIFEVIGPHALVFPRYIMNPTIGLHFGRARGPFLEAGADGLAMFTGIVASLMLLAERRPRKISWLLWLVIILCAIGILLSETRQVWLGAGAGALIAALFSPKLRRRVPLAVIVLAAVLGATYFAVPGLQAKLKTRADNQRSLWDRYNSDSAALRMVESKPLLGFGWFEFPDKGEYYYHVARTYPLTDVGEVHNVALSNAVELGGIGVILWLAAVGIAMISPLLRRGPPELEVWKLGALAIAIAWFVQTNFAPVTYAFDNYIPWVFAAIAYGASVPDDTPGDDVPVALPDLVGASGGARRADLIAR